VKAQTIPRRCTDCMAEHICTSKIDSEECKYFYRELRVLLNEIYRKGQNAKKTLRSQTGGI